MTSLLFGLLHPHTLAKLCSVFKVLTPATQVAFVIISEASCFCQELFFWYLVIYLSSLVISDSRQFNILPSLNLSVKNFFVFIFALLSVFFNLSRGQILLYRLSSFSSNFPFRSIYFPSFLNTWLRCQLLFFFISLLLWTLSFIT